MLPVRMLSFFILIFSLCDADITCRPENNSLNLNPPEIIAEYGGNPVTVNCTTAVAEHNGMYFTVGNETSRSKEGQIFISHSVSVSDWNVKAECKLKLNDSQECIKDLQVITYKNPEVVHSAQLGNVMGKETQYWLQCDIINVAPVQYLTVSWYKNNESIQTESFNDTTAKTPVNKSSILRVNISREENVIEFRCEAQLKFGPHGPKTPVISQTQNVSAHYAPELNTNSTHDKSVVEGTNISLSCKAEGNPLPVYNWTCDGQNILKNTNSLNITRVSRNKTCTCTATNYLGNITKTIHIHVEPRGCPLTLTPSETVVTFGDPISINCSTSAKDVEGMGWEAPFGGTGFEPPPAVTWRVEKLEQWTPSPSCYVTLGDGSQCTVSPVITVYKTPDSVSVSDMGHGPMVEDREYDLKCDIYNAAPVQNLTVTWYRGNETVHTQTFNDSTMTPVNKSSTLKISTQRDYNGLTFRCEAALHLGPKGPKLPPNVTSPPYTAVVLYAPEFKEGNESKEVLQGENVTFSCSADSNPPSNITWIYTAAMNSNVTTEGRQKIITITRATPANAGYYICVAENKVGRNKRFITLMITGKSSKILFPLIWVSLTLLIISLILLVVCCRNHQKKRGHYSFFPLRVPNDSNIPLTTAQANGIAYDF